MPESAFTEYQKRWTKLIGGTANEYINAMTTGLDGSIYVGGYTSSSIDDQTNAGAYDGFLAKYSPEGTKLWTKLIGGTANDYINAMTTGIDGSIYVGGSTFSTTLDEEKNNGSEETSDGFLAKYSPEGIPLWTKLIGGISNDTIWAMTTGLDGSIYVGGSTSSSIDEQTNAGVYDGFLAKYSPEGTKLWTKLIGDTGNEYMYAVTTCLDGSIYVGGYTTSTTLDSETNSGSDDGFLAKYSPDGILLWTKLIGGTGNEIIRAMTTGLDGSIYVGGRTYSITLDGQTNAGSAGTSDGFLAKYSPDGIPLWTKLIGGTSDEIIWAMTTGLDGSIYVGGYTFSITLDGQTNSGLEGTADGFLAKYTPDGTKLWTKLIGGTGNDEIRATTTGLDGSIFIGGYTLSSILDGQYNAYPTGNTRDGFVARYSATSRPFRFRFPSKMEFSTKEARHFRAYERGRISNEPASIYWRISPKLPEGLKFNTKNGKISGTPVTVFGERSFTVTAYSSVYTTDRHRITLRCVE